MKNVLISNIRKTLENNFGNELLALGFEDQREILRGALSFVNDNEQILVELQQVGNTSDFIKVVEIAEKIVDSCDSDLSDFCDFTFQTFLEDIWKNIDVENDFYIETPCGEFRLIDKDAVDEIWTESLIDQIKECYDLDNVPSFVEIDWDKTAENCKVDGLGHHFSNYDGQEHFSNDFHIFRVN